MLQHLQLINRAKSLGIKTTDVSDIMQRDTTILEYNGISELVMDGVPTSWINARSQFYCDNKQLTKIVYEKLNIPYPKSIVFETPDDERLPAFFNDEKLFVCKPLDATNGVGVVMDIQNMEMVRAYFEQFKHLKTLFLLEEQVAGEDLRVHVIQGKIVAACIREPAFVTGNGVDSLELLIEKRRAVMKTQNPYNFLEIDDNTQALLVEQGIKMEDIPAKNQKVRLKYISNIAQGGVATDITDEIHPDLQKWVTDLSSYLNTGYYGLDLITTDHKAEPKISTKVLEINARGDWMHHTFSERRTHDMSGLILEALFNI